MTSKSLIPVDNSTLQCEDGTLLRHGVVGMTIAQIMHEGGKVVTEVLDAGYCGPHDPKNCIQEFFSEAEKRERALDQLYETNRGHDLRTKAHQQLLKHCQDLLKYARPESALETQLLTFKILVRVITRYPGIRILFHHPKPGSKKASPPAASDFEHLWNRPHENCGKEWTFYRDFAIYCLNDSLLTKLVESELPSKFSRLKSLGANSTKDPIESLLSFCGPDCLLDFQKVCAIRYLAGVLELPKFWKLKTEEGNIGERLFGFLSLLCDTIFQLIRDTKPSGKDDSEDESPLWTSARFSVDILAFVTFGGFLQLHNLREELPHCPLHWLPSILSILTRPEMERSFPKACKLAPRINEIVEFHYLSSSEPRSTESDNVKYHTKAHDFQRHDDEEEKEVPRVKFHTKLLRKVTSKRGGNAFDPLKPGALLLMAAIHHDDDEEEEEKDPSHPNVWERTVKFRTTLLRKETSKFAGEELDKLKEEVGSVVSAAIFD